jgi:ketosteroid isomerase-like protein
MRRLWAGAALLGVAACASHLDVETCSADMAERAAAEVMVADNEFAALAQSAGPPEAFAHYAAEDVVTFDREDEVDGRDRLIANFADWPQGAKLEWAPVSARGAPCGDMAWTWGRSTYTAPDGAQSKGRYVTVWKRDASGQWRFGFDAALRRY